MIELILLKEFTHHVDENMALEHSTTDVENMTQHAVCRQSQNANRTFS